MPARIFVLAGVNGAGKSSVGGAALLQKKVDYFNPDLAARALLDANPGLSAEAANAQAWEFGRKGLERALAKGLNFAFETTLGARTMAHMLLDGARQGAQVHPGTPGCRRRSCTSRSPFSTDRVVEATTTFSGGL